MNNQQQCSTILMALAIIAATMLVSTVIVEALDLIDDAEAKKGKRKSCPPQSSNCRGSP
jgi:hypothetical protein